MKIREGVSIPFWWLGWKPLIWDHGFWISMVFLATWIVSLAGIGYLVFALSSVIPLFISVAIGLGIAWVYLSYGAPIYAILAWGVEITMVVSCSFLIGILMVLLTNLVLSRF